MTSNVPEAKSAAVADLAERINEAHAKAKEHADCAVECARQAGELLLQAKAGLKHGDWQGWLRENVTVTPRMAQQYMRLARELPKLSDEKRNAVSHLPIRYAIAQLSRATPALIEMDADGVQKVVEIGESGERLTRAVRNVEMERKRDEHARNVENWKKEAERDGVFRQFDIWTTRGEILVTKALEIEAKDFREGYWRDRMSGILPNLPEYLSDDVLPAEVMEEMKTRRDAMQKELARRVDELVEWAHEQYERIADPIWSAIDGADEQRVLLGRKTVWPNGRGEMNLMDMRNWGIRAWVVEHKAEGCECGDALPLGCVRGRSAGAAVVGDTCMRCRSCGDVLRHRNYHGEGDLCCFCAAA